VMFPFSQISATSSSHPAAMKICQNISIVI
jgi:hypothetical protein